MGRESKLRNNGSSNQYSNGVRKLFDPDKVPDGCDEDVWSLALYFSQVAEDHSWPSKSRVIIYQVLCDRLSRDQSLKVTLDKHPSPVVLSNIVRGVGGVAPPDIYNKTLAAIDIVEMMIEEYYSSYSDNKPPSIDDFCSYSCFNSIKQLVINKLLLTDYKIIATRYTPPTPPLEDSRPTPLDNQPVTWYDGPSGSESAADRLQAWRDSREHRE